MCTLWPLGVGQVQTSSIADFSRLVYETGVNAILGTV